MVKFCQEKNFNTGFFEGSDNNIAVDAYELKVNCRASLPVSFPSLNLVICSFSGPT